MARVIGNHLFYVVFFLNYQLQCLLVVAHTTWKTKRRLLCYRMFYAHVRGSLSLVLVDNLEWIQSVFTHVANIYANSLEQKKVFTKEKSSTLTRLVWNTNVAATSMFRNINMAPCSRRNVKVKTLLRLIEPAAVKRVGKLSFQFKS